MKITRSILAAAIIGLAAIGLSSCSVKLGADGSKEVLIDANAAYSAAKIIAEK